MGLKPSILAVLNADKNGVHGTWRTIVAAPASCSAWTALIRNLGRAAYLESLQPLEQLHVELLLAANLVQLGQCHDVDVVDVIEGPVVPPAGLKGGAVLEFPADRMLSGRMGIPL